MENRHKLEEGLLFSDHPKTFQDAVMITGWFQISYLWIDSLCIIQDSHDEWLTEPVKMRHTYTATHSLPLQRRPLRIPQSAVSLIEIPWSYPPSKPISVLVVVLRAIIIALTEPCGVLAF